MLLATLGWGRRAYLPARQAEALFQCVDVGDSVRRLMEKGLRHRDVRQWGDSVPKLDQFVLRTASNRGIPDLHRLYHASDAEVRRHAGMEGGRPVVCELTPRDELLRWQLLPAYCQLDLPALHCAVSDSGLKVDAEIKKWLQGWEAVGRLRVSSGLEIDRYGGSFFRRTASDMDFPALHCDHSFAITLRYDSSLNTGKPVLIQFALVYSTSSGTRRIRRAPEPNIALSQHLC